jgi:hypothetical protein
VFIAQVSQRQAPNRGRFVLVPAARGLDLFAGIRVSDYETAKSWYERLLGAEPSFLAHATEAVWELAGHRFLFIVEDAEGAGRAIHTIFVDDLDALVADIASRGIEPDELVTYPGKARKAIYSAIRCRGNSSPIGIESAPSRAAVVRSPAAWRFAS